jgi:hypothetical protein
VSAYGGQAGNGPTDQPKNLCAREGKPGIRRVEPAWHRYSAFVLSNCGNGPWCADSAQETDRFDLFLFFSISIFLSMFFRFLFF